MFLICTQFFLTCAYFILTCTRFTLTCTLYFNLYTLYFNLYMLYFNLYTQRFRLFLLDKRLSLKRGLVQVSQDPKSKMADSDRSTDDAGEEEILQCYFYIGFEYRTIIQFLEKFHVISISLRTLLRKFERLNPRRRGNIVDENVVREHIRNEIEEGSVGKLRGYRSMWHTLRIKHNLQVPRNTVAKLLRKIDPDASMLRQQRRLVRRRYFAYGPNFSWHADGKLVFARGNQIEHYPLGVGR